MPRTDIRVRTPLLQIVCATKKEGREQSIAISFGNIVVILILIYGSGFATIAKAAKSIARLILGN